MTNGSVNGRVLNNVVREVGDDMIAVVSYAQSGNAILNTTKGLLDALNKGTGLNKNILIAGNNVSNNYWGRGISVIGGDSVTITGNTVTGVPGAGGIMVAREHNWRSHGVNNVLVEKNTVQNIQNTWPPYNPGNKFTGVRSGHGTVELHDFMFTDEYADPAIREKLTVKNVMVRNNVMKNSYPGGARTGVPSSGTLYATDPNTGKRVSRTYQTGITKMVGLIGGTMSNVNGLQLREPGSQTSTMSCSGNSLNGAAYPVSNCTAQAPTVTGARFSTCTVSSTTAGS